MCDPDNRIGNPRRLAVLQATGLMDSDAEESFDRLTRLAVRITGASASAVTLLDEDRQFFKSAIGLDPDWMAARQTPIGQSACRHVLISGRPLALPDLRDHPEIGIDRPIAYLGAPLSTQDGQILGALCVIAPAPRDWSEADIATVTDLAACAGTEIDLRLDIARRAQLERELSEAKGRFDAYMENSPAFAFAKDRDGRFVYINGRISPGFDKDSLIGQSDYDIWPVEVADRIRANDLQVWATNRPVEVVEEVHSPNRETLRFLSLKFPFQAPDGSTLLGGMAIDITELSRTEEALRRVEAESRTLAMAVARIDGAVAVADAGGRLQFASEAYRRLFEAGASAVATAGCDLIEHSLAVAGDPEAVPALQDRLLAGERIEFALGRFDDQGDRIWVELEVQAVRSGEGQIDQFVAIARDVTEQRRTEGIMAAAHACDAILAEAAGLAEAIPRLLSEVGLALDVASATYWEPDQGGMGVIPRLRWDGPGWACPEPSGDRAEAACSAVDPIGERLRADLRAAQTEATEESPGSGDRDGQHLITPDGFGWLILNQGRLVGGLSFRTPARREPSRHWVDLIVGLSRKVGAFVGRKQAEEDRNRLAAIFEASDDFFGLCDPSGQVLWRNKAYHETVGTRSGELPAGFSFDRTFVPWAAEMLRKVAWPEAVRTGTWLGESAIRAADGRSIPVSQRLIAHRGPDGEVAYFATILRDITAFKTSEAELRKAKEAAEAASRAKSEFLANMSHEIRTPMNGILGMTELTLDTELTPLQREYLGMVRASGESLLRIINDILDFSRIEAGRLTLEVVEFDLHALIYETLRPLALRAHAVNLDLICQVDPDVPTLVRGDPHRLRQVLVNLVGNAVKFTPKGEILVRVVQPDVMPGAPPLAGPLEVPLRFSVADTGVGIPLEKLATIFEPFEQADNSTSRTYGGSGLGLAISAEIVHLMRGRLWVESQPGRGSTFFCDVPLGRAARSCGRPDYPGLAGRRILVAVDNTTRRRYIVADLLGQGLIPVELTRRCSIRAELARPARSGPTYDLALIDDLFPDPDMPNLIREGSAGAGPGAATPLVFLSTAGRPASAGLDKPPARSVPKPASPRQLMAALCDAITERPGPARADALPLGDSPSLPPVGPPTNPQPRSGGLDLPKRRLRVLLAEDQLVNRKVAARMLERLGHAVVTVQDGQEVLAQLRDTPAPFDVLLMDIQMPVMDGFEAARVIRCEFPQRIPMIALTAHAMSGDRERCLEAGFDDYLSKPITSRDLETILGRAEPTSADGDLPIDSAALGVVAPLVRT